MITKDMIKNGLAMVNQKKVSGNGGFVVKNPKAEVTIGVASWVRNLIQNYKSYPNEVITIGKTSLTVEEAYGVMLQWEKPATELKSELLNIGQAGEIINKLQPIQDALKTKRTEERIIRTLR